jgi:hypothetical protein
MALSSLVSIAVRTCIEPTSNSFLSEIGLQQAQPAIV